ncbi:hypothetical protein, partial [Streptomyces albospinus]
APPPGRGAPTTARPAAAKVVFRDHHLTWRAASCLGQVSQALDLDKPTVTPGLMDDATDIELDYVGCQNGRNGAQAVITVGGGYGRLVRAGTADAGTNTGEACRAAAESNPLGANTNAGKITPGTVWCVVTTRNQVAKMTFDKVDTTDSSSNATADNPTFELSVTVWAAP